MANIVKLQGGIDSWGYQKGNIEYQLSHLEEGAPVELQVDSLGGDVSQAKSIQNLLKAHGNVTAHIVGYTASAATWVCCAAEKIVMNADVLILVHQTSNVVDLLQYANADDLDKIISDLQKMKKDNEAFDLTIANQYVKHSNGKLDLAGALNLMKEAKWLTADEALKYGLIDEISQESEMQLVDNQVSIGVVNALGLPALPARASSEGKKNQKKNAKKNGLISAVTEALKNYFGAAADQNPISNPKNTVMNKEFTLVNALLKANDGLQEADGKITLTVDQLKTINEALASKDNDLKKANDEKKASDDALASAINEIDGISEDIKAKENLTEKVNAIKEVMNKVAGVGNQAHGEENNQQENFAEIAKDEINHYWDE